MHKLSRVISRPWAGSLACARDDSAVIAADQDFLRDSHDKKDFIDFQAATALNEGGGLFMQSWLCKSAVIVLATMGTVLAAGPAKFDGEFVDKKFLNGQGVFEFSVHQSGNALEIGFDAAYSDGHGATPDATGAGKVNGNTAQFTWKDSFGNTGTGVINLAGEDIVVSMKTVHVVDSRCLVFYRENMKLKRIGKSGH